MWPRFTTLWWPVPWRKTRRSATPVRPRSGTLCCAAAWPGQAIQARPPSLFAPLARRLSHRAVLLHTRSAARRARPCPPASSSPAPGPGSSQRARCKRGGSLHDVRPARPDDARADSCDQEGWRRANRREGRHRAARVVALPRSHAPSCAPATPPRSSRSSTTSRATIRRWRGVNAALAWDTRASWWCERNLSSSTQPWEALPPHPGSDRVVTILRPTCPISTVSPPRTSG